MISLRGINLRGWICVLLAASFAVAQSQKPSTPPKAPTVSHSPATTRAQESVVVPSDAAVITIPGVCDKPSLKNAAPADCKTVITRAEFERLLDAVAPTIAPAGRKQLATQYAVALAMVQKAHELGLDRGPKFDELMKVARVGVLTKELSQKMQDEAGKISDQEVAAYYHNNESSFQEIDLQRIFILHGKQVAENSTPDNKEKPTTDAAKKAQQDSEEAMKKLADTLRTRAAAGEDFDKLQDEAAAAAEFKGKPPTKLGKIRRTSLPPAQADVMNLKSGETSQLISTPNGYLIYKAGEKDTLPLDKVHDEIISTLRSQRLQDAMQAIQQSATPQLNEKYFADTPSAGPQGKGPADGQRVSPVGTPDSGSK